MKLRIFSLSICLIIAAHADRASLVPEDVYLRIKESLHDYFYNSAKYSESEMKALRERTFAGLDDREKIRALAEWMFRVPPPTHSDIPSIAGSLLIAPEPVIRDFSEFQRLMAVETDSRRFFQLAVLAPAYDKRSGHDFMVDRARGLFLKGPAADRGQSTVGYPLDSISAFWFSYIAEQLRDEDQKFKEEVYPELVKQKFEQRPRALAKWLKENRPGCENLDIPSESSSKHVKPLIPKSPPEEVRSSTDSSVRPPRSIEPPPRSGVLGAIVAASLLAVSAALWYVFRRK